ncbi:MAG: arginine repressor [Oscillospiraceae bacterium]|nr:arginine repressor [Oscillospiraceae bacterium]
MKSTRQNVILSIIEKEDIETQNQLMEALAKRGITSTQATLSRDIRELHLVKTMTPTGIYRYTVPAKNEKPVHDERLRKIFRESVTHHTSAQNIIVLKTLPGLAGAAASTIDGMHIESLAGTIAGDDTALLIMQDAESAKSFCKEIDEML